MRGDIHKSRPGSGRSRPEWLEERLRWFLSLKLGIIVHWAPYCQWDCCESWPLVPEDTWSRRDEIRCWTERGRDLERFQREYWNLPTTFNPTEFDPDAWAALFAEAGAKYVCFTTKHHDGFCMWDTKTTDYKVTAPICPFHADPRADIVRQVFDACRRAGLAISVYFSKADWHCPDYWNPELNPTKRTANTLHDPEAWERFVQYTHAQIRELLTDYGPVDLLWLDAGWVAGPEDIRMAELAAMARSLQPGLIMVNRAVGDEFEDIVTPERELPENGLDQPWEACLPICPDWKYVEGQVPRTAAELHKEITWANANGGNFLLGVGPDPLGRIPEGQAAVLRDLGSMLRG